MTRRKPKPRIRIRIYPPHGGKPKEFLLPDNVIVKRLVRTDFVNPEEKDSARDRGQFYIEEGKGETSTLESLRLDTTTKNQLRLMEKWSQKIMEKQLDKSDLIRLAIHSLFKQWDRQVKGQN